MTSFDLFARAERIETLSEAMYGQLARQFHTDKVARTLFMRLEAEEHQHASRIRLFASQYRANPKLRGKLPPPGPLEDVVVVAENALAEIKAGAWGTELRGVKARMVVVEAALSTAHAQVIAQATEPGLREFFEQLAAQDRAHHELLED